MNPIDIKWFAANADDLIAGLESHRTRGPILVTRDGEPEAVIIRHRAWAPRLHHFEFTGQGRMACLLCFGTDAPWSAPVGDHLGIAVERANAHWREKHMPKRGAR